jgi:hypothetical protein
VAFTPGSHGEAAVPSWVQYSPAGWGGHELAGHVALLHLTSHEHDVTQSTLPHVDGVAQSTMHAPGPQLMDPQAAIPLVQVMSQAVPGLQSMLLQALVPVHLIVQS